MNVPVTLTWYGCDLLTGAITEELPSLEPTQALSRKLGAVTSCNFTLLLGDNIPTEWAAATDPGRTMVVAVDNATGYPVWAGIVLTREGGSDGSIGVGACSPEGYLDRRYPGTYSEADIDASTVMADLAAGIVTAGPPFLFDVTASGLLIDYLTLDLDDKTVLSQIQTISQMAGAPEWTVDVQWADADRTAFQLLVRIAPTIGAIDERPEAVFDLPGCIASYRLSESYEQGKGATVVQASGEGEGDARVVSDVQTATDLIAAGWPRWVHRYTPGTGITDVTQLNAHAQATLELMKQGARTWSVEAFASAAPRLGSTWGLGDSISIQITRSPRHPTGASVVGRAFGWDLDIKADKLTPLLLEG
jgi:hypothetical protein